MTKIRQWFKAKFLIADNSSVPLIIDFLLLFSLALVTLSWFKNSDFIMGSDANFPLSPSAATRYLSIWDPSTGTSDSQIAVYLMPIGLIVNLLTALHVYSPFFFERIEIFLLMASSGFSMYFLGRTTLKEVPHRRIAAISASIFYMFNFYSMITIWTSLSFGVFEYAFFPLILGLMVKGIVENKGIRYGIFLAILWTTLVTPAYVNLPLTATDWAVFLLLALFCVLALRKSISIKKSLTLLVAVIISWSILNFYWVVINFESLGSLVQGYSSQSIQLYTFESIPLLKGISLAGYWGFTAGYKSSLYYPYSTVYSSSIFSTLFLLLPVLVLISLVLNRKIALIPFFALIAFACISFAAGQNSPFAFVNQWIFLKNPVLSIAFRSPYQMFIGYATLGYSVLVGALLGRVDFSKFVSKPRSGIIMRLTTVVALLVLLSGLLVWPMWTGNIFQTQNVIPSRLTDVPDSYYNFTNWLDGQPNNFYTMSLPYDKGTAITPLSWNNGTNGYWGEDPFLLLSNHAFLISNPVGSFLAESLLNHTITNSVFLNDFNVKYIIVHEDANWAYIAQNPSYIGTNFSQIEEAMSSIRGLKLSNSFGNLLVYQNSFWKPSQASSMTIQPGEQYSQLLEEPLSIWASGETIQQTITISNSNSFPLLNYQLEISVPYRSWMQFDFSDLRFSYLNTTNLVQYDIPFWIANLTPAVSAQVWLKLPFIPANNNATVFEYSGSPILTGVGDPESVFYFFDDFGTSLSKWTIVPPTWTVAQQSSPVSETTAVQNMTLCRCKGDSPLVLDTIGSADTLDAWFRFGDNTTNHFPFLMNDDTGHLNYWLVAGQNGHFEYYNGTGFYSLGTDYHPLAWYHIQVQFNYRIGRYFVLVNGSSITPPLGLPIVNDAGQMGHEIINWEIYGGDNQTGLMWMSEPMIYGFQFSGVHVSNASSQLSTKLTNLNVSSSSPSQYSAYLSSTGTNLFILTQPFDVGWTAYLNGQRVANAEHVIAPGYLNGWIIQCAQHCSIEVVFSPQIEFNDLAFPSIVLYFFMLSLIIFPKQSTSLFFLLKRRITETFIR